jgi:hypothetical protein
VWKSSWSAQIWQRLTVIIENNESDQQREFTPVKLYCPSTSILCSTSRIFVWSSTTRSNAGHSEWSLDSTNEAEIAAHGTDAPRGQPLHKQRKNVFLTSIFAIFSPAGLAAFRMKDDTASETCSISSTSGNSNDSCDLRPKRAICLFRYKSFVVSFGTIIEYLPDLQQSVTDCWPRSASLKVARGLSSRIWRWEGCSSQNPLHGTFLNCHPRSDLPQLTIGRGRLLIRTEGMSLVTNPCLYRLSRSKQNDKRI